MKDIYKYKNYKLYLTDRLKEDAKSVKAVRTRLAEAIGCQSSYLSQVLNAHVHFNLEQAHRANKFFFHTKDESRYFLLLIEYARAGDSDLTQFLKEQIEELQKNQFDLKKQLKADDDVPLEAKQKYYSSWYYAAIHIGLAIPGLDNPYALSERLALPLSIVISTIKFLESVGLVVFENGKYKHAKQQVHLNRKSDFIQHHHINWRSQSLQAIEKNLPDNLHYSYVGAVSGKDFEKIKELFIESLKAAQKVAAPSKSEELIAISLDCFKL